MAKWQHERLTRKVQQQLGIKQQEFVNTVDKVYVHLESERLAVYTLWHICGRYCNLPNVPNISCIVLVNKIKSSSSSSPNPGSLLTQPFPLFPVYKLPNLIYSIKSKYTTSTFFFLLKEKGETEKGDTGPYAPPMVPRGRVPPKEGLSLQHGSKIKNNVRSLQSFSRRNSR